MNPLDTPNHPFPEPAHRRRLGVSAFTPLRARPLPVLMPALLSLFVYVASADVSAASLTGIPFDSGTNIAVDAEGAHSVKTADLDGDGVLDVISASRTDGHLRWYRNEGGAAGFTTLLIDEVDGIYIATPGDADADGDIDLFVASVSEVRPQLFARSGARG